MSNNAKRVNGSLHWLLSFAAVICCIVAIIVPGTRDDLAWNMRLLIMLAALCGGVLLVAFATVVEKAETFMPLWSTLTLLSTGWGCFILNGISTHGWAEGDTVLTTVLVIMVIVPSLVSEFLLAQSIHRFKQSGT